MPLWEQVKSNLVEWYSVAADKTEELAKIGMRRYDKFGISRDVERQFTELGNFVFEAHNRQNHDFFNDPTFVAIIHRIQELEKELQQKEHEIDDIRQAHAQKAAAKAQAGAAGSAGDPGLAGIESSPTGFAEVSPSGDDGPTADGGAEPADAGSSANGR
jgi:hypothetical protein